jgi:hypothetical protein
VQIVYITDKGDDRNIGLSPETPVYTWARASKLKAGRNDVEVFVALDAIDRIKAEIIAKAAAASSGE